MSLAGPPQKRCPDCGAAFECGMGQETPCWCSREFAPVMPLPTSSADCYCAKCLAKHVALSQQENRKEPT
jgi:hypothetical protein